MRIGELARRTGVEAGTLRAWERRFKLLSPGRSRGGQRQYSEADVERVLTVRRLVDEGLTVAAAVRRVLGIGDRALPSEAESLLLHQIVENLEHGIVVGRDARTRYVNRRAAHIVGCSVDDFRARSLLEFIPDEELPLAKERMAQLRQGVIPEPFDQRLRRADGTPIIVECHIRPMFDRAGRYEGSVSIMRDVTEQRQLDDEVHTRDFRASAVAVLGARALAERRDNASGNETLLHEIVEAARRLLGAEHAAIFEVANSGKLLSRVALPEDEPPTMLAGSGSLGGYTILARAVVVVDDVATERRFDTTSLAPGTRSAAAAPVVAPGGSCGVLVAQHATPRSFDTAATDFLQSLANVVGTALR